VTGTTNLAARRSSLAGPFTAAVRAEWTKLWSVRSTLWALLAAGVIAVAAAAMAAAGNATYYQHHPFDAGFDALAKSFNGFVIVQLAMGVIGILSLGSEYESGSIRGTLAAVPRRRTLLAAKATVLATVSFVAGEIIALASFLIAQAFLAPAHLDVTLDHPGVPGGILASGWYLCVVTLIGVGLAAALRSTAGAIGAFVALLLILPQIVPALPPPWNNDIGQVLAPNAAQQLASLHPDPHGLAPLPALLTCCVWVVVALAAGLVVLTRRDA
jgi:ABC-2 type transport system permease protein